MDAQFEEIEFNYVYRRRFLAQIKLILVGLAIITALYFILRNHVKWIGNIEYIYVPVCILLSSLGLAVVFSMIDKKSGIMASELVSTIIGHVITFIWNGIVLALCSSIVGLIIMVFLFVPLLFILVELLIIVFCYAACEFLFELIYNLIMMIIEMKSKALNESVTDITDRIPMILAGIITACVAFFLFKETWEEMKDSFTS